MHLVVEMVLNGTPQVLVYTALSFFCVSQFIKLINYLHLLLHACKVESYNPADNKWIPRPSLTGQPKGSLAGATLQNKIFAIGGGNGRESFSEVEMLDSDLGRWIMTQSMLEKVLAILWGAFYLFILI